MVNAPSYTKLVHTEACHENSKKQIYQLNMISLNNPKWPEEELLAINKHVDLGVELASTEKQVLFSWFLLKKENSNHSDSDND